MRAFLKDIFLGIVLGGTMSVPGVSGGTVAIALGIYERILHAAGSLFKRENFFFLIRVGLGGLLGFFTVARAVIPGFQKFPIAMTLLFCGAATAGIIKLAESIGGKRLSLKNGVLFLCGLCAVLGAEHLPQLNGASPLWTIPTGLLLAAGIILPGISTSHLLVVLGLYENLLQINRFRDLAPIVPAILSTSAGLLLLTRPLSIVLKRFPHECRTVLLGFSAGSLKALIFPCFSNPQSSVFPVGQAVIGAILFGISAITILQIKDAENVAPSGKKIESLTLL